MAIDERDYMRESSRRIVEGYAVYNPREFRSDREAGGSEQRRRSSPVALAYVVWLGAAVVAYSAGLRGAALVGLYVGLGVMAAAVLSYTAHSTVLGALSAVFLPGIGMLAVAFLGHSYQVGAAAAEAGKVCHAAQIELLNLDAVRVSANLFEVRASLRNHCAAAARVRLAVELFDASRGHLVSRTEAVANFGEALRPEMLTPIVQPVAIAREPGAELRWSIQVIAVDGGAL